MRPIRILILATLALALSCNIVIAQGPFTGIKSSFTGGEFSPSLYSRIDLAKYATGARTLRNFIIHPHGGISNRPGLEYIATERTDGKKIRLIPFEFSTIQTYVLEFGERYTRFFKDGESIEAAAADTYAKLLLHCDGADQGTTFTDEAGKTVSVVASAQLDVDQKVFGTASGLFDGDSDYLTVPDHADWNFGIGNFTIDFWVRFNSVAAGAGFCGQADDASNFWNFYWNQATSQLYFNGNDVPSTSAQAFYCTWAPSADTWYHIAMVRSSTDSFMFIDGVSQNVTYHLPWATMPDLAGLLNVGYAADADEYMNGWIEEFRLSKGKARWTSDFSLPMAAHDLSGNVTAWTDSTSYILSDFVEESDIVYRCLVVHTSGGTFAPDLAAGYWVADSIYEVATPYLEDDLVDLQYTQSADVLYLTHPDHAPRQLERAGDTDWSLNLYAYENGPFQLANTDATDTLAISATSGDDKTLTASGFTLNSLQIGSLFKLRHYVEGQAVTEALDAVEASSSIKCGGTWRLITHGTWTATIRIEKSTTGAFAGEETMLREFSSADDYNADTFGTEDMFNYAEPFFIRVNMTADTSGTCNINLTADPFYQEGIVKVTAVAIGGVTATANVVRTCAETGATIDWSESSWSNYRGWPAVVEFHPEDRLVFGNTPTEPYTYWMTRTGSYLDFSRSSPLQDDDGISSPLPGRKVNGINGLIPLNEMVALTLANEVSIRSASGPISPTTVSNKVHGWEGSYGVRPVVIGNRAIYVQSTGTIIRDLGFELASDSFVGADLTIFSNHLFENYIIEEIAYQQNPDRIVWAIRSDGILLSMTYMREQEVVAWSWHDTNDGDDLFESVCTIRGSGYDEVWVSVNRSETRYIERMVQRLASTDLDDQFFVDCGTTFDSDTTTTFSVSQLASKDVSVLADGVVISDETVSAGGVLTLDTTAEVVQVGIGYNSDLETLNVEVNLQDGTAQGRKVHISNVVFRLLDTQGGYVGHNSDNLFSLNLAANTNYSASSLFSGDHSVSLGAGYAEGGRLFYRQSDPLPVTITGLIPTVTVGGSTNIR